MVWMRQQVVGVRYSNNKKVLHHQTKDNRDENIYTAKKCMVPCFYHKT